ncbi:hypothetical protein DSO57_1024133 [Entomophthora muscae]|uniref:Uncharacterized protein n=1 Tax=Entomophthora muscae TaxID=34485 RepID=A0ACC2TDT0_9FUNG|nr:hypothetical protein DSO57_1024133 [Entomophthora muscae]
MLVSLVMSISPQDNLVCSLPRVKLMESLLHCCCVREFFPEYSNTSFDILGLPDINKVLDTQATWVNTSQDRD